MSANGVRQPNILVVDADQALLGLLELWLADYGFNVVPELADEVLTPRLIDLVVVDVPFPRQGDSNVLKRVANEYPGTPILALSSTFFAGIDCHGAVAQRLGVASVLPKPIKRDALVTAVRELVRR